MDLPKLFQETCEEKKQEFRTKLVPIVSSGRAATLIAKKWAAKTGLMPDAFVLEGPKAGGHLGFGKDDIFNPDFALENLVGGVVDAAKALEDKAGRAIPVICGGGVFSGEDIAKMISLGASGVQMATRFVATEECDADIRFKEAYVNATEDDITIIQSPVGMPGRALKGKFIEASREGKKKPFKCVFHCIKTCGHPVTMIYADGFFCIARLMNWQAFLSDSAVTVQVFMTYISHTSVGAETKTPTFENSSAIASDSY